MVLRFATPEKSVREYSSSNRPRSLASQRKSLEDRMNQLRRDLDSKKKGGAIRNSSQITPQQPRSQSKGSLEDRMKSMARQLDKRKQLLGGGHGGGSRSSFNPLPNSPSRSAHYGSDVDTTEMSDVISEISTISAKIHDFDSTFHETSASLTSEMTAKIAEIESIEDLCAKENIPQSGETQNEISFAKRLQVSVRNRSKSDTTYMNDPNDGFGSVLELRKSPQLSPGRPISTKSLRSALITPTRNAKFGNAKFGNGRSANLDHNILDVKFSRKLKDLGTRTRRLNSISIMRQNFNNARAAGRQRSSSVQINPSRSKMISQGRTRLNSLTGEDGLSRRAEKLSSLATGGDRQAVVDSGRQRLNSITSADHDRMQFQGSLLGLKNRTIGAGAGRKESRPQSSLAKRTQRLGSVSDIRQQLMDFRNNRNQPAGRDKRSRSVSDIKPNYNRGGLDAERARALNERLRQLGTGDIRSLTRNALAGSGEGAGERKRKGIDLETIRQIKSDFKAIQNKEYGALASSTSVPARFRSDNKAEV